MRSTKIAYQEIWRINSRLSSIQLTYVYSSKICTSVSICMEPKLRLYWVPNLKDLQFSHCCGNQSVAFKLTFLINGKYTLNWNCNMICDLWFVFFFVDVIGSSKDYHVNDVCVPTPTQSLVTKYLSNTVEETLHLRQKAIEKGVHSNIIMPYDLCQD